MNGCQPYERDKHNSPCHWPSTSTTNSWTNFLNYSLYSSGNGSPVGAISGGSYWRDHKCNPGLKLPDSFTSLCESCVSGVPLSADPVQSKHSLRSCLPGLRRLVSLYTIIGLLKVSTEGLAIGGRLPLATLGSMVSLITITGYCWVPSKPDLYIVDHAMANRNNNLSFLSSIKSIT